MDIEGGCYCGALRYQASGEPMFKMQCHCRECQYFSGGHPNVILGMPTATFSYTRGEAKTFVRDDIENPSHREYCGNCGTHILTRAESMDAVIIKVGTLDDPAVYGTPEVAIQTADKQAFHHIPEGMPAFERWPD